MSNNVNENEDYASQIIKEKQASKSILKHWRSYILSRKMVGKKSRKLLDTLGEKADVNDIDYAIENKMIFIQIRGKNNNPLEGHSAFHLGEQVAHLRLLQEKEKPLAKAKYPIIDKNTSKQHYTGIILEESPMNKNKLKHYAQLNQLYVLPQASLKHLNEAIEDEVNFFKNQPYSYGIHYNCNTFVHNVLVRVKPKLEKAVDLGIKDRINALSYLISEINKIKNSSRNNIRKEHLDSLIENLKQIKELYNDIEIDKLHEVHSKVTEYDKKTMNSIDFTITQLSESKSLIRKIWDGIKNVFTNEGSSNAKLEATERNVFQSFKTECRNLKDKELLTKASKIIKPK